jgi:outer membrane protein insertion porin family
LFPFYENYYAGGFTTLRGFGSNSAGPKAVYRDYSGSNNGVDTATSDSVGGNAIALASLELIVPTPFASDDVRSQIRTSFFIDAASVWDTEFDYRDNGAEYGSQYYYDYSDPTNYRASYGVALQWMSPMGPLVFSLASPLKSYEGDNKETFTFTIGRTF